MAPGRLWFITEKERYIPPVLPASLGCREGAGHLTFFYFHLPFFGNGDNQPEARQGEQFVVSGKDVKKKISKRNGKKIILL